jgi:hypothetical protein
MFTPSEIITYLSLGTILGALFGSSACLYLPPTAEDPHPGRSSAIAGGIGGGIIFAIALLLVSGSLAGIIALVLLCLAVLAWRHQR